MDGLVVASEGDHSVLGQEPLQSSVGGLVGGLRLAIGRVIPVTVAVGGGEAAVDGEALRLR